MTTFTKRTYLSGNLKVNLNILVVRGDFLAALQTVPENRHSRKAKPKMWKNWPAGTGRSRSSCCWSPACGWSQCRRRGGCNHQSSVLKATIISGYHINSTSCSGEISPTLNQEKRKSLGSSKVAKNATIMRARKKIVGTNAFVQVWKKAARECT